MDDHQLQLQIPNFVYHSTLVQGGGAELINGDWFPHSAFAGPNEYAYEPVDHAHESSSNPFDYTLPAPQPLPPLPAPASPQPVPDLSIFLASQLPAPSSLGLPVYSASGFDLLSILARVATRPAPRIVLGPVDLTCSFVVVDARRYDHPIVYCSPSFCTLTGYDEPEVLGRNCRFLQAPGGSVAKGDPRKFTSQDAVNHLRKSLMADKECQTSIVNYKKNGAAFINLVTVIPVPGGLTGAADEHDIVYQVGFQVDLTEQPNAILEKLRDGSYLVNYASPSHLPPFAHGPHRSAIHPPLPLPGNARDRKANAIPPLVMSKVLRRMLADPTFLRSIPITNTATTFTGLPPTEDAVGGGVNHPLSMLLLEASPAFIHVVSIKGDFQYVAPSVRRVLGYEAEEMVGTSISHFAHPEDVVPLMRELKESSATSTHANATNENTSSQVVPGPVPQLHVPRSVDLLFRAKTKMGRYVWVECRGRLLAEPGKGKKAVILSGRAREMMSLKWDDVRRAGGLARALRVPVEDDTTKGAAAKPRYKNVEQEVWGVLGGGCKDTATFMSVGKGVTDVLGWTPDELLGRGLAFVLCDDATAHTLGGFVATMRAYQKQQRLPPTAQRGAPPADPSRVMKLRCCLRRKDGEGVVDVWFVLYRADAEEEAPQVAVETRDAGKSITPAALVYQIRVADAETMMPGGETATGAVPMQGNEPQFGGPPSSSLAGAVTYSGSVPAAASPTGPPLPPPPSVDMFDELSTSRGSSWQYELQQLRIANLRLREELAALEAEEANAGTASSSSSSPSSSSPPAMDLPRSAVSRPAQPSAVVARGYEAASYEPPAQRHRVYAEVAPPPPAPPLFTSQPQQSHRRRDPYAQLQYDYERAQPQPQPPPPDMRQQQQQQQQHAPYLHQPVPLAQYAQPQRGLPPVVLQRPSRSGTPQEWNTGPAPPGYGTALKRSWSQIDGA